MQFRSFPIAKGNFLFYYVATEQKHTNVKGKFIMFKTAKSKFIFQLVCSFITLPIGAMFLIAILDGLFGVDVSAIYDLLEPANANTEGVFAQFLNTYSHAFLIIFLVIHILAFIGSGGAKYSLVLYAGAVKGAFLIPVPILNLLLGVIVAVVGLFFIVALAPIFAFFSTIKNHIESKEFVY